MARVRFAQANSLILLRRLSFIAVHWGDLCDRSQSLPGSLCAQIKRPQPFARGGCTAKEKGWFFLSLFENVQERKGLAMN